MDILNQLKLVGANYEASIADRQELKRRVAELERQRDELVAENAALKSAAEFSTAPDMWEELGGNVLKYQYAEWYADILKTAMKTPKTDAALREIGAKAVDKLICWATAGNVPAELTIEELEEFAQQLREGKV
ncbi:hypothetical protein ACFFL1_05965 [Samsonia erythrinae]|uniref:Uncharacterized protein n=1 Tax=Samsonia erythrinae TaxID=160434 RepID=A0A4R3VK06_9GAMM|nr:hypothetical protein [Samsonia erythrinae]TCV04178.1 hypothetical protein EDC54_11148 [Samsonia erythrinae]